MDSKIDVPLDADKLLSGAGQPPHTGDGLAVIAEEFQDGKRGICVCELIGINGEDIKLNNTCCEVLLSDKTAHRSRVPGGTVVSKSFRRLQCYCVFS